MAPDGRLARYVAFDPDDLDAAFAELDARYLAGEGAPFADGFVGLDLMRSYNARDWDAFEAILDEDFTAVDHRNLGWGTRDAGAYMATMRGMVELAPEIHGWTPAILGVTHRGSVSVAHVEGVDTTGNPFDIDMVCLVEVADGLWRRLEIFPPDQADEALRRLHELDELGRLDSQVTRT